MKHLVKSALLNVKKIRYLNYLTKYCKINNTKQSNEKSTFHSIANGPFKDFSL